MNFIKIVCSSAATFVRQGSFAVVLLGLLAAGETPSQAVDLKGPPTASVTDEGVMVAWQTTSICGTRLAFTGADGETMTRQEGSVGLHHEVLIKGLRPGRMYHVKLGTARLWLAECSLAVGEGGQVTLVPKQKGAAQPTGKSGEKARPPPSSPAKSEDSRPRAPPTHQTWGYMPSLQDHFERHGKDFRCISAADYAAKAWLFLQQARQSSLPMKWDQADETLRVWDPQSRTFAAYNRDGTTKTFFRPNNPSYWSRQPGRPVKPSELPFNSLPNP